MRFARLVGHAIKLPSYRLPFRLRKVAARHGSDGRFCPPLIASWRGYFCTANTQTTPPCGTLFSTPTF
ncbi:hypothetical protein, partial [Bradyrhizobium sp. 159]|uniref:hypothetical protein n=1 Tax=Bradyrhizobium sp. 159 TaxID=2782632 RepID=UPI001FF954EF